MKYYLIMIVLFSCFSSVWGQIIKVEYLKVYCDSLKDTLEITKKITCKEYPISKETYEVFIDKISKKLKFINNWDAIEYWIFIGVISGWGSKTYQEVGEKTIKHTNWWLKEQYYKYYFKE